MELPLALREAMEQQLYGKQHEQMIHDAQALSLRYRTQGGRSERLLKGEHEAAAYAIARMPATFGAVFSCLQQTLEATVILPETLLDAGAGTGAASWAADSLLELNSITCLERESAMMKIGKAMMEQGSDALRQAKWIQKDLVQDETCEHADLVIAAYVLNEMTARDRLIAVEKLWSATGQILLLIEPGTPAGFSGLMEVRKLLLQTGAYIVAPCPLNEACPKTEDDWCHFSCRIARSRLHRQMKGGEAPFEDEKFCYLALSRHEGSAANARVLRHPQIHSGHVTLEVCTSGGIQSVGLSKKDGDSYRKARKVTAGDSF
ncbi:MAG: rRNA methyltransferase [Thermoclostridium sp.]|nr:rRNA methyltransferase [Thermoclostridium sp.]